MVPKKRGSKVDRTGFSGTVVAVDATVDVTV
jgi:hypothetical protein